MAHYSRSHAFIPAARALTDTSIDDLIRPGLHEAFHLPAGDDPTEKKFCGLLAALALSHSASADL